MCFLGLKFGQNLVLFEHQANNYPIQIKKKLLACLLLCLVWLTFEDMFLNLVLFER